MSSYYKDIETKDRKAMCAARYKERVFPNYEKTSTLSKYDECLELPTAKEIRRCQTNKNWKRTKYKIRTRGLMMPTILIIIILAILPLLYYFYMKELIKLDKPVYWSILYTPVIGVLFILGAQFYYINREYNRTKEYIELTQF